MAIEEAGGGVSKEESKMLGERGGRLHGLSKMPKRRIEELRERTVFYESSID